MANHYFRNVSLVVGHDSRNYDITIWPDIYCVQISDVDGFTVAIVYKYNQLRNQWCYSTLN